MAEDKLLQYFIESTDQKFTDLKVDIALIHSEIKDLSAVRWKAVGMVVGISAVFSIATTLLTLYFMRGGTHG